MKAAAITKSSFENRDIEPKFERYYFVLKIKIKPGFLRQVPYFQQIVYLYLI